MTGRTEPVTRESETTVARPSPLRIMLVDDHPIVRDGLRRVILDELGASCEIGEASSAPEAVAQVRQAPWDLVVLDISMPGGGGLEALKEMRVVRPEVPVLVMTMYPEDQYALRAFREGAAGYITKGSANDDLVGAIRKVVGGGKYVSGRLAEQLATSLHSDVGAPLHEQLSNRELQVLRMTAAGKAVKEIGAELGLSEKTISTYRARVLEKLNMRTTAELIRYSIRANLVD